MRRFSRAPTDAQLAVAAPTAAGLLRFLRSRAFARYLLDTTELELVAQTGEV